MPGPKDENSDPAKNAAGSDPVAGNPPSMPEIITREEARAKGLKRYFTGEACKGRGHVSERLVANRGCIQCELERDAFRAKISQKPRRKKRNGRYMTPRHVPTEQTRELVRMMVGFGLTLEQIGHALQPISGDEKPMPAQSVLRTYRQEIDQGLPHLLTTLMRANLRMVTGDDAVYDEKGNCVRPALEPSATMAIYLSKTVFNRAGIPLIEPPREIRHTGADSGPIQQETVITNITFGGDAEAAALERIRGRIDSIAARLGTERTSKLIEGERADAA